MSTKSRSIVFFHPDLGIGGAERLVIDAAVGLQNRGHRVTIFTSHCDKTHCFTEARDGTLDVRVRGNTIVPRSILGRFAILCAIARQLHLVLSIAVFTSELAALNASDLVVDQLSACVPLLRILQSQATLLFYCHFPDKLLATRGNGAIRLAKSVYRVPFDALESWSTACADVIVVNSRFTGRTVKKVFRGLAKQDLKVVYPCVDTGNTRSHDHTKFSVLTGKRIFLSINRFEGKKDVALAVKAFAGLSAFELENAMLILAGGYDARLQDNVSTLESLQALADSHDLPHQTIKDLSTCQCIEDTTKVLFLPSISDNVKRYLLQEAVLLIYTPRNEHFGIVPLEAMLCEVPVLAANEGGPVETVLEGQTGWLRDVTDTNAWTKVLLHVLQMLRGDYPSLQKMGKLGRVHVEQNFSKTMMAKQFEECLQSSSMVNRRPLLGSSTSLLLALLTAVAGALIYKLYI